jgi:phosphatidate cytidylyltransferase
MFFHRILVIVLLLPIALVIIFLGGEVYVGLTALICGIASLEYVRLFAAAGLKPNGLLVVGGSLALIIGRAWNNFQSLPWIVSLIVLTAMVFHLIDYENGRDQAATDFGVTLGGVFYLGWLGAFLVSLRFLPEGQWWLLIVLPSVWFADSGAYIVGSLMGRHPITKRLSPRKTWEGYFGGILFSIILTALLALLWRVWAGPFLAITPERAALIALILSSITIFGDLGASMIKRQVGVKDSGKFLPGHGGAFDRIDTWLWAGVIGYFLITFLFQ